MSIPASVAVRVSSALGGSAVIAVHCAAMTGRRKTPPIALSHQALSIPDELPIAACRDEILAAIQANPVVIVSGDTGSGKTTQLPKICLAAGRGVHGEIACTQPRRIAARTLATRVAAEMSCELGTTVGYQVRFEERRSAATRVRFMTDGMLLAHSQRDHGLSAFDTLLIDEAHERSLNIDLLLGLAKRLLRKRRQLRVIVTSATLDTQRFAAYFDQAPILQVSGRSYPVEIRYRPPEEVKTGKGRSINDAIVDAVQELDQHDPGGDLLVFLSGERAIRDAEAALQQAAFRNTECIPLYARLSAAGQQRVFKPDRQRRIVLTTNVAETSLTVPRIRYVIDTGLARISRYSHRSKVQRLPVEAISQASAAQRTGRCGRLGPGVCIRLYDQADHDAREEFTPAEILRTSLASVILRMADLRLGPIEEFDFVQAPPGALINDGYRLLLELGAMTAARKITAIGRQLSAFPVDVRLGRMLLAAGRQSALQEVLIIVAALSVQDPRERPADQVQAADTAHARFADENSDFVSLLNLWRFFDQQLKATSKSSLRRRCQREFLSWRRMWEWRDVYRQLRNTCRELGLSVNTSPADYPAIHQAVLSGLLSHIGRRDEQQGYDGARARGFRLFPGSGLARKPPKWVMSAFLVETARVYGRVNAAIETTWIEAVGKHLLKRTCEETWWDARSGRAMALEQVSLYGLVLASQRRVALSGLDPATARDLFIREALVRGRSRLDGGFVDHNSALIQSIADLEDKKRARDLLVDESVQEDFFARQVPAGICTVKAFKRWYARASRQDSSLLCMSRDLLLTAAAAPGAEDFPSVVEMNGARFALHYHFERGAVDDGVTLDVPLHLLNRLDLPRLEWLVPGMVLEKVTALIRGLPKALRRNFVPAPDFARAVVESQAPGVGSLAAALGRQLKRMSGVDVPIEAWDAAKLEPHLRMNIRLLDAEGCSVTESRDPNALQRQYGDRARACFAQRAGAGFVRDDLTQWDFGPLPDAVRLGDSGTGFPALTEIGGRPCLRLFDTRAAACRAMGPGLHALLQYSLKDKFRYLRKELLPKQDEALQYAVVDRADSLLEDSLYQVGMRCCADAEAVRDAVAFDAFCHQAHSDLGQFAQQLRTVRRQVLAHFHALRCELTSGAVATWPTRKADLNQQLAGLVHAGFLRQLDWGQLVHLPRYLQAMRKRIDDLQANPGRDAQRQAQLAPFVRWLSEHPPSAGVDPIRRELHARLRWLLEEFRVSLFAQTLGTPEPVSAMRLERLLGQISSNVEP